MESQSLPGFKPGSNYTGERKGGPDPYEEDAVFQTSLPLLNTYITYFLHKKFLIYLLHLL